MTQGRMKVYVIKKAKRSKVRARGSPCDWACESEPAALIALFTAKTRLFFAHSPPTCSSNLNVCAFTACVCVCVCARAILCGCVPHVRMNKEN